LAGGQAAAQLVVGRVAAELRATEVAREEPVRVGQRWRCGQLFVCVCVWGKGRKRKRKKRERERRQTCRNRCHLWHRYQSKSPILGYQTNPVHRTRPGRCIPSPPQRQGPASAPSHQRQCACGRTAWSGCRRTQTCTASCRQQCFSATWLQARATSHPDCMVAVLTSRPCHPCPNKTPTLVRGLALSNPIVTRGEREEARLGKWSTGSSAPT